MASPVRPKTERKKKAPASPVATGIANDAPPVSRHDIALRAFAYYCERGGQHGADVDDWLRAERDLLDASRPARRRSSQ